MNVVADASVLVAELLRARGRALFCDPGLQISVAEEQWSETQHELERRLRRFIDLGRVNLNQIALIRREIRALVEDDVFDIVPRHVYHHLEVTARRRVLRDPNDWPTVALALASDADILTSDNDFLGCGCATWIFETLREKLAARNTDT